MSRYLADRITQDPRIEVHLHTEVGSWRASDGRLEAVVVQDTATGERQRLPARDLMVFIGGEPEHGMVARHGRPRRGWLRA